MIDARGELEGFAYVREDDAGDLSLTVPMHPGDPLSGGPARLVFTDGASGCAAVDFTIEPLPEAAGELAAVVDLLRGLMAEQAATYGATLEELAAAEFDELHPSLWPIALTLTLLDDPANDASLQAIAEGSMGSEALDWIERLLARTDLRSELENRPDARPAQSTVDSPPTPPGRSIEGLLCEPDFVNTGDLLDFCMSKSAEINRSATGLSRQVSQDIQRAFAELDSRQIPLAGEIKTVFGAMFWLIYTQREQAAALLPSRFTFIEPTADGNPMAEDDGEIGRISASVSATSLGYNLQEQILDGINQAIDLVDATGKFDISTGTPLDDVASKLAPQFESRIRDLDIEELDIPSELFQVYLDDGDLLDTDVVSGSSVVVDDIEYEGQESGPTEISVRTADGRFGGAQIADQMVVTVGQIQVSISPDHVVLPADAVWTFDVTVSGSVHPDSIALADEESLQGQAALTIDPNGAHYVTYVAPTNPDPDSPDLLAVEHTARTGARSTGEPRRVSDPSRIDFGSIVISPRGGCVPLNGTKQFTQESMGLLPDDEVVWHADVGDIDQNGLYTAPSTSPPGGEAVITASSSQYPDVSDEVTIDIGCECGFALTVGGNAIEDAPGYTVGYYTWNDPDTPDEADWITFTLLPPEGDGYLRVYTEAFEVTGIGTYVAGVQGTIAAPGPSSSYSAGGGDPQTPVEATIEEYTVREALSGFAAGQVFAGLDGDASVFVDFDYVLTVNVPDDYTPTQSTWGTLYACTVE